MEHLTDYNFLFQVFLRSLLAVIIGGLIGSERAKHGRAAGMRTHILVCLGSCLTSMVSIYASLYLNNIGDLTRISAQVISGIGFLGAGMIILKNNNVITGLTTAAGVWTTSVIGIALGFGFYAGAIIVTFLFLLAIILFARFERKKKSTEVLYIEIDNMYEMNRIMLDISKKLNMEFTHHTNAPKSMCQGHLGINLVMDKHIKIDMLELLEIKGIVFVEEEQ